MTTADKRLAGSASVIAWGRLLLLAALVAGIFGMHGLTMPSALETAQHRVAVATAEAAEAAGPLGVVMPPTEHRMPMPSGGHTGHDLTHTCVAVLTVFIGFAALALSATALAGAAGLLGGLVATSVNLGRGRHPRRQKPGYWSITQLCISRT